MMKLLRGKSLQMRREERGFSTSDNLALERMLFDTKFNGQSIL